MILGQRVRVYYNLHRLCLSVMDKKSRLVIAHTPIIHLTNCRFIVSAAGLARVRREKRKSVIAFVEGDYTAMSCEQTGEWKRVYFNPYKVDQFMMDDNPIEEASSVIIKNKSIYAKGILCGLKQ